MNIAEILMYYQKSKEYNEGFAVLKQAMLKHHIAWWQTLACDQVGVHSKNRGGLGVSGSDAQIHGLELKKAGFVLELTNPVAVQKDPEDDYELNWNLKQIEMSKGLLPGMMMLLALSIGTSHTNVWCRQVKAGVRSLFPDLGNVGGKLDAEVLTHGKPDFKQAVFHEMKWLVLHHQIEQAFPGLIDFVQKALNVTAQNQRSESEVMRDMWTIAEAMEDNVDWSIVEDSAERSLAPRTKYLPAMT